MTKITKTAATNQKPVAPPKVEMLETNRGAFPVLNLEPDKERYGVSFGLRKCRLILASIAAIQKFVRTEGREC